MNRVVTTQEMADAAPKIEVIERLSSRSLLQVPVQYTASLIEASLSDLEMLSSEWSALAATEPNCEPFFQPYFFHAFAKTFNGGRPVPLVVVRKGLQLKGILPLRRRNRFFGKIPARVLSSLSGIHSCRYDFVCSAEDRDAVALAAWKCLKQNPQWSVVEAMNVPEGGAFEPIMRHAQNDGYLVGVWPTLLSPYLTLPVGEKDPFKNCPAQYRKDRKRFDSRHRKLKELGEPVFEVFTQFSEEIFQKFITLEGAGWKGKVGGGISCNPTIVEFYREVLKKAAALGQLRMCALRVADQRIAMEVAFVIKNRCYSPKIAYNEEFSKWSPGQILAKLAIEDLHGMGFDKYDLLGPRARYKTMWAGDVRPHANCYIFRPTVVGRFCHFIATKIGPVLKRAKYAIYGDPQSLSERFDGAVSR